MLAQIADLRLCALMSPASLCRCALMFASLCRCALMSYTLLSAPLCPRSSKSVHKVYTFFPQINKKLIWPVGRVVTRSSKKHVVRISNFVPVKLDTFLQKACNRYDICSKKKKTVQLGRNDKPSQHATRVGKTQRV